MSQEARTQATPVKHRATAVFNFLKRYPKVLLPVLVLTSGLLIGGGMVMARPSVATRTPSNPTPMVHVLSVKPESVYLKIHTQGTVAPRTESDLIAEVSGRITWVSASLASGGFIEKDAPLIEIDARDYEVAMTRAKAALSRTESQLALAKRAAERQRALSQRGVASPVSLDDAENALLVMEANRLEAEASLTQARHDLQRTQVKAPFAGRIRNKHVDVGQFVNRGNPVARIYAVDYAEVRLPIPDDAVAFVDLPINYRGEGGEVPQPKVVLTADFGGKQFSWNGRIVRTEGELDPRTRMIHAVARIEDPYGRGDDPSRPPFAVGLFVEAEIEGRLVNDVYSLPHSALRGNDRVLVVDSESRARVRPITLLQRLPDRVLVASGLELGDRVVTSPLALTVDGMPVEVESARARARTP
ncbi:MAG: efflux RND transporter periplasmic adaptor subunit [Deltaproteobacteria bacterium]|nr:efflux RND transporter periplasmic adaptor subunit [Deltaproteobacteria bacterium]MBW2397911.1 efflux RND transporter periplasmic adaptor subunit [Deltaproteobacteria bacterium]MBW2665107.1 efflux RND transporter periplasmic adaptor subunit [Deltaproteobacteria bacterium]